MGLFLFNKKIFTNFNVLKLKKKYTIFNTYQFWKNCLINDKTDNEFLLIPWSNNTYCRLAIPELFFLVSMHNTRLHDYIYRELRELWGYSGHKGLKRTLLLALPSFLSWWLTVVWLLMSGQSQTLHGVVLTSLLLIAYFFFIKEYLDAQYITKAIPSHTLFSSFNLNLKKKLMIKIVL